MAGDVAAVATWPDGQLTQPLPADPARSCEIVAALAAALSPERAAAAVWTCEPVRPRR